LVLIDETGKSCGRVSWDQAMFLAYEKNMDVVLVNATSNPPIAKLIDYTKELYRVEKAKRKQRAKHKTLELKEIKLSVKIEEHDLETKANHAKKFLQKGHRVRLALMLRGREMLFRDKVRPLFDSFTELAGGEYEEKQKQENNRFKAIIKLKK